MRSSPPLDLRKLRHHNHMSLRSHPPVIAIQGEPGSFSDETTRELYGPNVTLQGYGSVQEAMQAVEDGKADAAVIPVENRIAGSVPAALVAMSNFKDIVITGEKIHPIKFAACANPETELAEVTEARSHPVALRQNTEFLQGHHITSKEVGDTAGAAKELAQHPDPHAVALAPVKACTMYDLKILQSDTADKVPDGNHTRFVVFEKQSKHSHANKHLPYVTTLVISHPEGAGEPTLCDVEKMKDAMKKISEQNGFALTRCDQVKGKDQYVMDVITLKDRKSSVATLVHEVHTAGYAVQNYARL